MESEIIASFASILCYVGSEAAFVRIKNSFRELQPGLLLALLTLITLTFLYYLYNASKFGKLPEVYCKKNTKLHTLLNDKVSTLRRPYKPPIWCAESRLQTIVRYFTPCSRSIRWEREMITDKEEGAFHIDWFQNNENDRYPNPKMRPTVLIVPGLTSTTSASYISSMSDCLAQDGYRVMVLIYRGLEGDKLKTPLSFSATYTDDLEQAVELFYSRYPTSDLYAVGASLGSLILGRYLSEKRDQSKIKAGVLFCCPFNPADCIKEMETASNLILMNYQVTQNIKNFYRKNSDVFEGIVDREKIEKANFMRDFDNHFTAPVFGFANGDEYYEEASIVHRLADVEVPLLCVGANDDPFSPEWALPKKEISECENVALVMTYGGGHVSHIQEQFPFSKSYFELVMVEYLNGLLPQ